MNRRGFSLLEVLILVFIIGLLATIGVSSFLSYRKTIIIKQQEERITIDLEYARQYARAMGKDTDVFFYYATYTVNSDGGVLKNVYLDKGFNVTPQHFGFTTSGTPLYSGTMSLLHNKIQVARLTISVGSGLIKWQNL